uniref:DUF2357 domain-containing protein n=1 Tax=candidate division WOR-3 bacterium TaxID=2052148 RepID=A0A7C3YTE9_UNCW3
MDEIVLEKTKTKIRKPEPSDIGYIPCGEVDFKFKKNEKVITLKIIANGVGIKDVREKSGSRKNYLKVGQEEREYEDYLKWIRDRFCQNKEDTIESIKKYLGEDYGKVEIEIYEPPLKWKKRENDYEIYEVDVEDKCLQLLPVKEKSKWYEFPIRLMENASYDVEIGPTEQYRLGITERKMWGSEYVQPFGRSKDKCHINFQNLLFCTEICVFEEKEDEGNGKPIFKIPILVYPKKLKAEEAEKIIKELLEWHSELLYDLEPTGLTIKPGEYGRKNPIQRLNFIRYLFKKRNLKGILNSIIENPHKVLIKEEVLKEIQDVETPVCHLLPELATESTAIRKVSSNPYHFEIGGEKYQFVKAYEEVSKITHDTYPNRFVKFFLKLLRQELSNIEEEINSWEKEDNEYYKKYFKWLLNGPEPSLSLNEMKRDVNRILNHNFFQEVSDIRFFSTPSQTLLKEYRYQQVFSAYLDLIKGVRLPDWLDELLKDPIKNMPELYEYWCFLKLWQILEEIDGKKGKPNINFKEKGVGAELKYGSEVKFDNKITLSYNIYYSEDGDFYTYSVPLMPDFSLKINNNLIIFDAKYRVEWVEEVKEWVEEVKKIKKEEEKRLDEIKTEEKRGTFVLDDLYKMHTYREAILRKEGKDRPLWVIALYPGEIPMLFREDGKEEENIKEIKCFLKEIIDNKLKKVGGVGAIPLRPEEGK